MLKNIYTVNSDLSFTTIVYENFSQFFNGADKPAIFTYQLMLQDY